MKKVSAKKRNEISNIWFRSKLKNSIPNLAMRYTEQGETYYFTIGVYSFNSITGTSSIDPLQNMEKMSIETVLNLIN